MAQSTRPREEGGGSDGHNKMARDTVDSVLVGKLAAGRISAEEFEAIHHIVHHRNSDDMLSPFPEEAMAAMTIGCGAPPEGRGAGSASLTVPPLPSPPGARPDAAMEALLRRKRASGAITAAEHRQILEVNQRALREGGMDDAGANDDADADAAGDVDGNTGNADHHLFRRPPTPRKSWEWLESLLPFGRASGRRSAPATPATTAVAAVSTAPLEPPAAATTASIAAPTTPPPDAAGHAALPEPPTPTVVVADAEATPEPPAVYDPWTSAAATPAATALPPHVTAESLVPATGSPVVARRAIAPAWTTIPAPGSPTPNRARSGSGRRLDSRRGGNAGLPSYVVAP